ncbi:MAG: DUF2254 domain-containing protein [Myxococcota bacterium]|nr:DUF2254 domain-containing protein [Myxococcota bacterium]
MAANGSPRLLRTWVVPFVLLLGAAAALFLVSMAVDASTAPSPTAAWRLLVDPDPSVAREALASAGEIVAAVLAIAITVVAIVVELAANRYTHRITELFVAEPINFAVMGFFVVSALHAFWVTLVFDAPDGTQAPFVPWLGLHVAVGMLTACLLLLLPYFAFVFAFLNPIHIVGRITSHTLRAIERGRGGTEARQREAVRGVEQLADVALNAMEHKDKGVSMASVGALRDLLLRYRALRERLPAAWFRLDGALAANPDFVSMAPEVLEELGRRRVWFEMKVLRQYQTIYGEALNRMRDINYVIAIHTRHIAEHALEARDEELFELVLTFFNTYLRATINARDVRTAYNVLNQYRLLGEAALAHDEGRRAVAIARYFKYYGLLAYGARLPFVLETVAYDLCALAEAAFDRASPAAREILRIFLEVDKEGDGEEHEQSLRGVRKAQVKLATHYLAAGAVDLARQIFRDMERERPERLASIRDELLTVESRQFWEVSDRGVNFDYLPPERRAHLLDFFGWFEGLAPPRSSIVAHVEPPGSPGRTAAGVEVRS